MDTSRRPRIRAGKNIDSGALTLAHEGAAPSDGSVPSWIGLSSKRIPREFCTSLLAASSANDVQRLSLNIAKNADKLIAARKERMEKLLRMSYLKTNDEELDIALMWAKLSLDALIMNQSQSGIPVKGIFAGLPWFNNYWGRDSFISLPGATFVTGNFNDARRDSPFVRTFSGKRFFQHKLRTHSEHRDADVHCVQYRGRNSLVRQADV